MVVTLRGCLIIRRESREWKLSIALSKTVLLREARDRLAQAQHRMKTTYDGKHRLVEFAVGDYVWMKLQPYRQLSVSKSALHKLSPRFYGPFRVLGRIGPVAYRLQLPEGSRIHDVFHVSLLKPHRGELPSSTTELPLILDGRTLPSPPHSVLRARLFKGRRQVLVQWSNDDRDNATWEEFDTFTEAYPDFELEDNLDLEGGSNVTDSFDGKQYHRLSRNGAAVGGPRGPKA